MSKDDTCHGTTARIASVTGATTFSVEAAKHGDFGLIIGALVVISTVAFASDQPLRALALLLPERARRWDHRHVKSIQNTSPEHHGGDHLGKHHQPRHRKEKD